MKLRSKVFCIFAVVAIIPLLILTLFAYNRYEQLTYQRIDEISSTLFDNALKQSNSILDSIQQTAGLFTFYSDSNFSVIENLEKFSDAEKDYDYYEVFKANQNIKFVCQSSLYANEYIYGLYFFTPSGVILGQSSGKNGDIKYQYDPSGQQWYEDTLKLDGQLYISSAEEHEFFSGGKKSLFFAQSLNDVYTHEFLGVLLIDCNPSLFDLSLVNTMPDITLLTISNTDNTCVLYSNLDEVKIDFPNAHTESRTESLTFPSLTLTAVFDYSALYREFNLTGILLLLVALVCAVGIVFLAYALSKNLVYPIEHLSRKMASQKGHSLAQSTRYLNRTDEIGTLYNEYNSMVEELNYSVKKDYQDKLILLDAQMKSLEARINSHFLFNTLESINSMAELADNEEIATMSLALGNMFRYTIKTQSELVPIASELQHVEDYVSIQQIRFSHKFKLVVDIEKSLRTQPVLKLILQPLVENSLYHGLNYCTAGDTITIRGGRDKNCLYLSVEDNGQGILPEQLAELNKKLQEEPSFTELGHRTKQSIGLKNIHSRIELYYGRGYGLTITSTPGLGTSIRIKLPMISKEESENV